MDLRAMDVRQAASPALDDCLKLLKGERDDQRMAGLFLVTKFCKSDDLESLRRVYAAVGTQFLNRLIMTGLGKGTSVSSGEEDNRDVYLQLVVRILAAFCHDPEIASSSEMVSRIPLLLEAMPISTLIIAEDCYEVLYLVASSSVQGAEIFHLSGGFKVVASHMGCLCDGSHVMELAIKLIYVTLSKLSLELRNSSQMDNLINMVPIIARQFAVSHKYLKFEALHLLSYVFSFWKSESFHESLCKVVHSKWHEYMRQGIVDILQNHLEHTEKLCALRLADSVVSILGKDWLIGLPNEPDTKQTLPRDRCLLLVLETSRIEIAVLLNELSYLKHEVPIDSSIANADILMKQQNLGTVFNLVEVVIKLIAEKSNSGEELIDAKTLIKIINGLNETVSVVMDFLKDAKEHGRQKGNDLLASVRLVGCYLSETPDACREKVNELLSFMLLVKGDDEISPFHSVCFILPMLCQITMTISGCKTLVSIGGYKAVVECLVKSIERCGSSQDNDVGIFLACDVLLNLLSKKNELRLPVEDSCFITLLSALGFWAENADDLSTIMMTSSLCALIFCDMSEEALLNQPNFSIQHLNYLSRSIARCMTFYEEGARDAVRAEIDLLEIIIEGYAQWSDRFPTVTKAVSHSKLSCHANLHYE